MLNFIQPGDSLALTVPYARGVTSGEGIPIGALFGVPPSTPRTTPSLPPVQDGLYDIRRQQRQPQQAAKVSPLNLLTCCHLADRSVPPLVKQPLVPGIPASVPSPAPAPCPLGWQRRAPQ
jgi:predicted RecA/RadA family phage recombinase